jgi:hypothetical protein
VPHQAETPSPAILPALTASTRRKRLILLCCEDLRPVACALEDALRSRGWEVDLELGADAKPWVQKVPLAKPSMRVLCVPGTIDRTLAQQLRAAYRPEPEADLHILGVDDSPGLVHEIERLAGVRTPARRSLHAAPRLAHATLVETQVRAERSWRVGAVSALAAFALTLGGMGLVERSVHTSELTAAGLATGITGITRPITAPITAEPAPARLHDPVLAAVVPMATTTDWSDEPTSEDDFEIVLLDDEELEPETTRRIRVRATPLAAPEVHRSIDAITTPLDASTPDAAITDAITPPDPEAITIKSTLPTLPPGFLPVAGLPLSGAAMPGPTRQLPAGFLPVAGMTVAPRITTVDPFDATIITTAEPLTTVDPFAGTLDAATP